MAYRYSYGTADRGLSVRVGPKRQHLLTVDAGTEKVILNVVPQ